MDTGAGLAGNIAGNFAAALPTMGMAASVPGAAMVGAGYGALQPTVNEGERGANTAFGAVTGAAGQKIAATVSGAARKGIEATRALRASNAARDATLKAAQKAGFRIPAAVANPTFANRSIQSLAGKTHTMARASAANARKATELAARAIGVRRLSDDALKAARAEAGQAYDALSKAGDVVFDQQWTDDLTRFADTLADPLFPGASASKAQQFVAERIGATGGDASAVVRQIRKLRADAASLFKKAGRSADPDDLELAHAHRALADALDNQLERHVTAMGRPELANAYTAARRRLAMIHDVDSAFDEAKGVVDPKVFARLADRGRPLTGELKVIADTAAAFPEAFGNPNQGANITDLVRFGGAGAIPADPTLGVAALSVPLAARALTGVNALARPSYSTNSLLGLQYAGRLALPAGVAAPGLVDLTQQNALEPALR
jgi:hypothetical protein